MNSRRSYALALAATASLATFAMAPAAHADVISLLASGTQSFSADSSNTLFTLADIHSAGSGTYNPIMRIQGSNQDNGNEQGYNSILANGNTMEDASNGPANPTVLLKSVVDAAGHVGISFDVNESGGGATSTITLEDLVLVASTNPNKSGPVGTIPFTIESIPSDPGDVTLYDMSTTTRTDAGHVGDPFSIQIDVDDNLASGTGGSGAGDLLMDIDLSQTNYASLLDNNHYLYVYARFSDAQGGYEEISLFSPNDPVGSGVPEPASLTLLAAAPLALAFRRRRRA